MLVILDKYIKLREEITCIVFEKITNCLLKTPKVTFGGPNLNQKIVLIISDDN